MVFLAQVLLIALLARPKINGGAASVMKTDRATSISTGGHDKNKVLVNITSEEEKTRIAIVRITRTEN